MDFITITSFEIKNVIHCIMYDMSYNYQYYTLKINDIYV